MSTSETTTFDANVCPCGKGRIVKHVTTQDNPWSSADISYELKCATCSGEWVLEPSGVALVSHGSWVASEAAREAWLESTRPLQALVSSLVDQYFVGLAARSKKAEWEEMLRLDIFVGSYRSYLQRRAERKSPGAVAYGLRNRAWLSSRAKEHHREKELAELITVSEARKKEWEEASKRVRRWALDSRR